MYKISFSIPSLVFVSDYHEFDLLQEHLRTIMQTKSVKIKEVGFCPNRAPRKPYVGLVYSGRFPSKKALNSLLASRKIVLN